jgi:hypothetical protein
METNNNIKPDISKQYEEKISQLNSGLNILLDEFKKTYVITKMNPNNQEYQQKYQNVLSSLEEILSNLFTISNDIQVNINDINKILLKIDKSIREERRENIALKASLKMLKNKNNASLQLISDYKHIYNYNYLRNWSLFLCSIICLATINSIFRKKNV